jgi:nucleotide-binding universal stress UspA family protein
MVAIKQNPYRTALVGLDLSSMDDALLDYLPHLLKALPLEKVFFVYIAQELELPEELIDKYPDLIAPLDESIAEDIRSKVKGLFDNTNIEYDIIVQEGYPLEHMLKLAKIKNIDLIVMGRKKKLEGSGLLAGHILRKSPTSIITITENHPNSLKKVLIPIDFSDHAALSIEAGGKIKDKTNAQINFCHVYNVPTGYHKTGKSYEEFAEIMESHAKRDYKLFTIRHRLKEEYPCAFLLEGNKSVADLIYDHAKEIEADMVLIGSRGRTKTSALLIGSIVEKLVRADSDIPVMVVKSKGENMGFFEALMKI